MKYLLVLLVFIWSTMFENASAEIYRGNKCSPSRFHPCQQKRGYIHYNYSQQLGRREAHVWKIQPRIASSVTLHLKALQGFVNANSFIKIVEKGYRVDKKHIVRGSQDQIFTFDEILTILVELIPSGQQSFELDFYIGCKVLKGEDLLLTMPETGGAVSRNVYSQWGYRSQSPTCWVIISWKESQQTKIQRTLPPWSIFDWYHWPFRPTRIESKDVTHKLAATIQNSAISPGSYLTLSDMLTGKRIINITEASMNISAFIVDTSNSSVTYNMEDDISAALFIDLYCNSQDDCRSTSFKFTAYALDKEDTSCTKNRFKCMLQQQDNTGQCDVGETKCKAYTEMVNRFFPPMETETVEARFLPLNRDQRNAFSVMVSLCSDYQGYCSGLSTSASRKAIDKYCGLYAYCQAVCQVVHYADLCRTYTSNSIFSMG